MLDLLKTEHDFGKVRLYNEVFAKECVRRISATALRFETGRLHFYGKVSFKNGLTEAEHEVQGNSFDEVILKLKQFIESL